MRGAQIVLVEADQRLIRDAVAEFPGADDAAGFRTGAELDPVHAVLLLDVRRHQFVAHT